jgi:fumarylacetoacetase
VSDADATWVSGAEGSGFGRANLPYGVVAPEGAAPRCAVRIGTHALDLDALQRAGLLELPDGVFAGPALNPFLALGREAWTRTRRRLDALLAPDAPERAAVEPALVPLARAPARLPVAVGDYVDFYASLEHATNLGRRFRPGAPPLLPNWRHLPVGYHGRAGSLVVSGTPVRRPRGQRPPAVPGGPPTFGPTQQLDVELELGFLAGPGSPLGAPIPAAAAAEHVFGVVLVNDWSARDLQRWEYQPLGPFLGKSFATSISAWVVPLAALEPHLVAGPRQDPEPLPYLRAEGRWALDLELQVELDGELMSTTNARGLYWTFPQLLAHATVNGAATRPGDLFATGTISGSAPGTEGSLIERYAGGRFLADGETAVLRGRAGGDARPLVSLGEVAGTIVRSA